MTGSSQDARVIVVGDTQVGKTTLINRFVDKAFTPASTSTVTPVFSPSTIITSSGSKVSMQLWDTAGQERYQSIGQVFYRNSNFAVICFNSTDSKPQDSINNWRTRILAVEPKCSLFLASTKFDLVPQSKQMDVLEKGQQIKEEIGALGFFATSAMTGDGIEPLFSMIGEEWEKMMNSNKQEVIPKTKLDGNNEQKKTEKKCC